MLLKAFSTPIQIYHIGTNSHVYRIQVYNHTNTNIAVHRNTSTQSQKYDIPEIHKIPIKAGYPIKRESLV